MCDTWTQRKARPGWGPWGPGAHPEATRRHRPPAPRFVCPGGAWRRRSRCCHWELRVCPEAPGRLLTASDPLRPCLLGYRSRAVGSRGGMLVSGGRAGRTRGGCPAPQWMTGGPAGSTTRGPAASCRLGRWVVRAPSFDVRGKAAQRDRGASEGTVSGPPRPCGGRSAVSARGARGRGVPRKRRGAAPSAALVLRRSSRKLTPEGSKAISDSFLLGKF